MQMDQFEQLVESYFEGDISPEDVKRLHQVVQESPQHREAFQAASRLHTHLREQLNEQAELQAIQLSVTPQSPSSQLGSAPFSSDQLTANRSPSFKLWATAAAIVLVLGWAAYKSFSPYSPNADSVGSCLHVSGSGEVFVLRAERKRLLGSDTLRAGDRIECGEHAHAMLQLHDGSILSMEPGSQLALTSARPSVELLQGEVLFEIAKRAGDLESFQVHTDQSTVDVMGTVFVLSHDAQTKLEVYEGRVSLTRHRDNARIEVSSQQMATTEPEHLAVSTLSRRPTQSLRLLPTDDATLDRGRLIDESEHLKVEGNRRVIYLRFDLPDGEQLNSARLQLTQHIDAGRGTLTLYRGSHHNWDEASLTQENAPQPIEVLATYRGVVRRGQVVEIEIDKELTEPGPLTLLLTLDRTDEDDIWFSSKEGEHPPQLILTLQPNSPAA